MVKRQKKDNVKSAVNQGQNQGEYVVATVDVKEQKLKLFRDTIQVEEYKYQLRG